MKANASGRSRWTNRNVILILILAAAAVIILLAGRQQPPSAADLSTLNPVLDAGLPTLPPLDLPHSGSSEGPEGSGEAAQETQPETDWENALYLLVTVNGLTYQPIPMLQEADIPVRQQDGSENVIHISPDGAWMHSASCDNQDCVMQGAVTRDNMNSRILYNMVICLPNRVMFEVLTWDQLVQLYASGK